MGGHQEAADRALVRGVRAHKAGDLDTAERHYETALQQVHGHAEALHLLGVVAHQRGDSRTAAELIGRAACKAPDRAPIQVNLGNALAALGQLDRAEAAYRAAVELDPRSRVAQANLGGLLLQRGRPADALPALQAAVAAAPDQPALLNNLALALRGVGRPADAAQALEDAVRLKPDYAEGWSNLGQMRQALADADGALAAHREAVRLAPESVAARLGLADAEATGLRLWTAAEGYQAILDTHGDHPGALVGFAGVRQMQGRFADARTLAERALRRAPDFALAHLARGNAVVRCLGDPASALSALERARAAAPQRAETCVDLAVVHYEMGAVEDAMKALHAAARLAPDWRPPRFYLAALAAWHGAEAEGAAMRCELERLQAPAFLYDSLDYMRSAADTETRLFACPYATLDFALARAPERGLLAEFGVFHGSTVNFLAARTGRPVHGFDSFEGLPEAWGPHAAGAYSAGGRLPEVRANVTLHAGWFDDTVPAFAESHPDEPLAFANVDCDLYSSTRTVLDALADRVVAGTILVFDEYIATARWREDEHKALKEAEAAHGWRTRYLAFNPFSKQAVLRVESV